jgi:C1A family cysteine protease
MSEDQQQQKEYGLGMIPDLGDFRDYARGDKEVQEIFNKLSLETDPTAIPPVNDYRNRFTSVRAQGSLGSCTGFSSIVGVLEYYYKNTNNDITQFSPLFQYKMTRNLMGLKGDTGASIRASLKALAVYGAVPEKDYPYTTDSTRFDLEPNENLKFLAQNFQALKYIRVDQRNMTTTDLVKELKKYSAANVPITFGFTVYNNSWNQANSYGSGGAFPFPSSNDTIAGGHAVCIAGHSDTKVIKNNSTGATTTGAFLFKNSWGVGWGEKGFGWLPYKYVEQQLAMDFWLLTSGEWIDLRVFN